MNCKLEERRQRRWSRGRN